MNIRKSFLSLSLVAALAVSSFASTIPTNASKKKSTTVNAIQKSIQSLKLDVKQLEVDKVKLKFMVNENNEIIVLSTEDSELDGRLKSALNYKAVSSNDLTPYKIYILPISFEG